MASDADSITLAIQLVDDVARSMLDLVEQAVACSRQLIDLLDGLAHAPTREPYRRIRILLGVLPLTWAVLKYVVKAPMALYLQQLGW